MDNMLQSLVGKSLAHLSVDERLLLIDALWESICEGEATLPLLTEAQKEDLDQRLDADDSGKVELQTWEDVKSELSKR